MKGVGFHYCVLTLVASTACGSGDVGKYSHSSSSVGGTGGAAGAGTGSGGSQSIGGSAAKGLGGTGISGGSGETNCNDGLDDDHDGLTDCADHECYAKSCGGLGTCADAGACNADGTCSGALKSNGVECRPARDLCDRAEICSGNSAVCPADSLQPAGYVCERPPGNCGEDARCDGLNFACPAVKPIVAGTLCRAAVPGSCETDTYCDGAQLTCPAVVPSKGNVCLAHTDECHTDAVCGGMATSCPAQPVLSGNYCGAYGQCSASGTCSPIEVNNITITFHTNEDGRQKDTHAWVSIGGVVTDKDLAYGTTIYENTDCSFELAQRANLSSLNGAILTMRIDPSGPTDTWRFNLTLRGNRTDGGTYAFTQNSIVLYEDHTTESWILPRL